MDASYEPKPRYVHCSALVQDKWYNYGGVTSDDDKKKYSPSIIEEFDPACQVWKQHPTYGDTPPGYIGSAATSIGSKFYHFGGFCGGKLHNTISELDVNTFHWKKLEPTSKDGICPIPKMDAGMISFDNRVLVTYGGKGITRGKARMSQLHCFDIETRKWYIPTMSGVSNLMPYEGCTFTKVDYYRAVLFGGYESENCLRILDMTDKNNWIWNVVKSSSDLLWPSLRGYHLAISLCEIGSRKEESPEDPQLMILFGMDKNFESLMDSWIYNFRKKRWTLGAFPENLVQRSAACVRDSTCLLYTPKSPSTEGKTLFQFGGVKYTHSSPMNAEYKSESFLYSTNVLEMDISDDSLVVTSAKHLKTDWLSVNPHYPELTHFEEERKQTLHLSPDEEQHMDLSDIGISLRIHGIDSEGDSEISVLPTIGGPFAMPEGYEPKSPVYIMNENNKKLKKCITVTMGHYANLKSEEDCKKMKFLKGCAYPVKEGSRLIYKFEVITGANGKFAKGDRQGEITLREAVPLCIAYKQSTSRKKLTTAYFLKLYSTPSPCDNCCAILTVSIYQDLYEKLLSSFMKKEYPALTESTFKSPIHFDEDRIKIKWDTGKAWTAISNIDPPIIRQEEVDLPNLLSEGHGITFEDGEKYPPRIKLTFTPEEPHVSSNCNITVLGLTEDLGFNLHLSMNSKLPETPRSPYQVKEVEPGHRETYLHEILSLLLPAASKWESIGIALEFSTGDLNNIKGNFTLAFEGPEAYLRVLIQQWLKWTPPNHNFPTLESLYNALKTPIVNEQVLAKKLFQKITERYLSKLMLRNPDMKTQVNESIKRLVTTTVQWKDNEMITKTEEVVSWIKDMTNHLGEPSDLFSKAGKIKSHCEAISRLSQDVLQEAEAQSVNGAKDLKKCKESIITISQLLHKQAHLQLTYSQGERMEEKWVPIMESVINQMIELADALKKLLEQTYLVVRKTPKSTKSNQWTIVKPLTRQNSEAGYVETMSKKMKDQIPISGARPRRHSLST